MYWLVRGLGDRSLRCMVCKLDGGSPVGTLMRTADRYAWGRG